MNKLHIFLTTVVLMVLTACGGGVSKTPVATSDIPNVAPSGKISSLDNWMDSFGYEVGQLAYRPSIGWHKSVEMAEQTVTKEYKCTALTAGTDHFPTVVVVAVANPSLLWESKNEYHRLVAIYANGRSKNAVTPEDIAAGVSNYLGQWQERMCALANKPMKELLQDPSLGFAETLTALVEGDERSPFDIKVQTVKVVSADELTRALALKGLEKPAPAPVAKKPTAKPAPAPQTGCCCNVTMVFTPACATNPGK